MEETIRRIQWRNTEQAEIDVYTSTGFAGRLTGPQAAAFNKVVSMGFAAAIGVVREAEAHQPEDAVREFEADQRFLETVERYGGMAQQMVNGPAAGQDGTFTGGNAANEPPDVAED